MEWSREEMAFVAADARHGNRRSVGSEFAAALLVGLGELGVEIGHHGHGQIVQKQGG